MSETTLRRVYVRLDEGDIERLVRRALRQRRHPADEAALLLVQALRAAEAADREHRDAAAV